MESGGSLLRINPDVIERLMVYPEERVFSHRTWNNGLERRGADDIDPAQVCAAYFTQVPSWHSRLPGQSPQVQPQPSSPHSSFSHSGRHSAAGGVHVPAQQLSPSGQQASPHKANLQTHSPTWLQYAVSPHEPHCCMSPQALGHSPQITCSDSQETGSQGTSGAGVTSRGASRSSAGTQSARQGASEPAPVLSFHPKPAKPFRTTTNRKRENTLNVGTT